MSDYEGEDWDRVDLPATHAPNVSGVEKLIDHVAPKGQKIEDLKLSGHQSGRSGRSINRTRLAKSFHPAIQSIRPQLHHGTGGRPVHRPIETQPRRTQLDSYKRYQAKLSTPDHTYELAVTWKAFVNDIEDFGVPNEEIAQIRLDNICNVSEAYISPYTGEFHSDDVSDTNKLSIWGTEAQCKQARELLQAWERDVRAPGKKGRNVTWYKSRALDGRQEHRMMQEQMRQYAEEEFQHADDSAFDFEAYLIWPKGHDLDAYLKKYEATVLRDISSTFSCRFVHEKTELQGHARYTKIQATAETNLLAAYQRLVNLVKEMIAQRNRGTHGNFFRLPSAESCKSHVIIEKDSDSAAYLVSMTGRPGAEEENEWTELSKKIESQNRKATRESLDTFLKTLYVSQSHVRLRIDFGELGLMAFVGPGERSNSYSIDQFFSMLGNPRTTLSDCMLRAKGKDMSGLVEVISSMDQFSFPEDAYKLMFDFQSVDRASRLRLETEMQPGFDVGEPEICAQRWLTSKAHYNSENILGVKLLDLEKPGYMVRADCFEIFTNEAAIRDMTSFQSTISFKPSPEGLAAKPRRRAVFPPGKRDLTCVTEITAKRFRFKDTDGTFELRREDEYDLRVGHESALPTTSRWAASYYYYEWDNLMGEFANIRPGETVSWSQELATFFPEVVDVDRPRSLPKGFKNFLREITEIQQLLADGLAALPKLEPTIQAGRIMPKPPTAPRALLEK